MIRAESTLAQVDTNAARAAFPQIGTNANRSTKSFKENHELNLQALAQVKAQLELANQGGGSKYQQRHKERGRLLPRERIEALLDQDSYFLDLCALAGNNILGETTGTGVVGGIGLVSGVECLIVASEATAKGGAITPYTMQKSERLGNIALENRLVGISLIESAGADLPNQDKIFVEGGAAFRHLTRRSEQRVPSICLVFGSSTAGGAYLPGMSDYVVMVDKQAQVYLAGPPLVKMATGEESDHESLGGARMHTTESGVSDFLASDELDAIRIGRQLVAHLNVKKELPIACLAPIEEPVFDAEELLGIASADVRQPFDQKEIIARIIDGSRFSEFKPLYGPTLVCGWAFVHGFLVGILANNGTLFREAAEKGAQFIQLCNQRDIPLIFLQNTTGFMVGEKYEREGIIKAGAKFINTVSNSTVPAITIMTGASYGAGNYAMCGRAYNPRFLFTWPNHKIAVMGGKQLAGVLDIVQREAAQKRNEKVDEEKLAVVRAMTEKTIEDQSSALYATARLWDDGIIDPRDTRTVLGICLSTVYNAPVRGTTSWGVFRH